MKKFTKILIICCTLLPTPLALSAQQAEWLPVNTEMKPGTRWWLMGRALDSLNLAYNLDEYGKVGMGTMEITPIYGVQGNDKNEIPFLSERWMNMYRYTVEQAKKNGMLIDMNTGTGWPFGGPNVTTEDAACKLVISEYDIKGGKKTVLPIDVTDEKQKNYAKLERLMAYSENGEIIDITALVNNGELTWKAPKGNWHLIAAFCGKTLQAVKRAAPGGEGLVIDHFSKRAVKNYLQGFDKVFDNTGTTPPHLFFNDSYEVYEADWTEGLFDEFERLRGYKLEIYLPQFLSEQRDDSTARIISDYRETLSDMLLENFTKQWTEWAHKRGSGTRNQAHGSPGNLIDLYATVDVPECEGFGLSDFGIKGLRKDSLTRANFSDLSMLKYASSAAHITGKTYTSSETFTWLTEHFRTSLSQCKPDLDLMFVSGVNHVFFHGTTYSPKDDPWPGWKFYASIDMSMTNPFWKAVPSFYDYITKCQSFLQYGKPDNDFLLYLPIYDIWYEQGGRFLMFDIHKMGERAPRFIEAVQRIETAGYDVDYISDKYIGETSVKDNELLTPGGAKYKAIIVPGAKLMPEKTLGKLIELADKGAKIVFLDQYPEDVPGLEGLDRRREDFSPLLDKLKNNPNILFGTDYDKTLAQTGVPAETLKKDHGLSYIRRTNDDGYHYFISALTSTDTDGWIELAINAKSVVLYNPMNGKSGKIPVRTIDGKTEVYMQLHSGESAILKTYTNEDVQADSYNYYEPAENALALNNEWDFHFTESIPEVTGTPEKVKLGTWTELSGENTANTMGTACYSTSFTISTQADEWLLSLGDVRESAKVRINGEEVGTLWAVPYNCYVGDYLHEGENTIEIEVTNLPANRIAEMDRQEIPWRKFKEINIVKLDYSKGTYANWQPMESGLLGPVELIPMNNINNK